MEDLQQATEKICDLKGDVLALDVVIDALLQTLSAEQRSTFLRNLESGREVVQSQLLGAVISEHTVAALERDVRRVSSRWS